MDQQVVSNAHPRVELVLNEFMLNTPAVTIDAPFRSAGHILHAINLTGFSGNTYFESLPILDTALKIQLDYQPRKVWSLVSGKPIAFSYQKGYLSFKIGRLTNYDGIVVER